VTVCFIGLGSNLEQPLEQIKQALRGINAADHITITMVSPFYQSTAIGPGEQPDYINAVIEASTTLNPYQLLETLQGIENQQGRERTIRWGARTIDLDILLFGDLTISEHELTIPHPRLKERNFVLYPLYDIAPELSLTDGTSIASLLNYCNKEGLKPLPSDSTITSLGDSA